MRSSYIWSLLALAAPVALSAQEPPTPPAPAREPSITMTRALAELEARGVPAAPVAPHIAGQRAAELEWAGRRTRLLEPGWGQGRSPEDSAYRQARETLNRGEYRRASDLFGAFVQKHGTSRYAASAKYYRAFALYRAGADEDLRRSLAQLEELRQQHSNAADDAEVKALWTRVVGTLASRGDGGAAARVREAAAAGGGAACDREDVEVRAEALSAIVQNDPEGSADVVRRILARRDECSVPLRRRAIYLLGKDGDAGNVDQILAVAKGDPNRDVRRDAIGRLSQVPGPRSTAVLEQFLAEETEEDLRRAVVGALARREDSAAARAVRRAIEREDLSESVRAEAVRALASGQCCGTMVYAVAGQRVSVAGAPRPDQGKARMTLSDGDVTFLRGVYERTSSRVIRTAIVETMARSAGPASDAWLVALVRNGSEDIRYRSAALGRLRRAETPIDELNRLYDALSERDLRRTLVSILAERPEPAASDKLIEIAKTGTDPDIRRAAISALVNKKDPRTTKLLFELVEK